MDESGFTPKTVEAIAAIKSATERRELHGIVCTPAIFATLAADGLLMPFARRLYRSRFVIAVRGRCAILGAR